MIGFRDRRRLGLATLVAAGAVALAVPISRAAVPLDPTFGTDGVSVIAGSDRYEAQGAPLLDSQGKIVVAGLLKNASDRVFLSGLTKDGATDTAFGTSGEVHTNTKATERRAVTARLADGKVLVGGRSDSGRLQLERFTATGARDTTFGSNGSLTVQVSGGNSVPTAMAVAGNSTFVALTNQNVSQRKGFVVAKLTTTGLDPSFGSGGVANIGFGSTAGQAFDVALDETGRVVVTGSFGALGTAGSNTRVVRLNTNGTLDTSFDGDGVRDYDASQSNAKDHGVAAIPVAGGGLYVASAAAGKASVAKLGASGALDTAYAGDGIAQGLAPSGASFDPVDAVSDAKGKLLVAGESLSAGTTRWAALRTRASGASPLDVGFGEGGYAVIEQCKNNAANGPSGLTSVDPETLLIAGGCGAADSVAVVRLKITATNTKPTDASPLEITPGGAAAGHERIPVDGLDPSVVAGTGEALQSAGLRRTGLRRTGLRRTGLRRTGLLTTGLRRTALGGTLLSELPLLNTTWQALLPTEAPLQTLTLDDAYTINPGAVGALTLEDIDPNATGLRRTSLAAFALGTRPLDALPPPDGGWCGFLASQPYNCNSDPAVSTGSTTLFDLEIGGDDLSAYYEEPISLLTTNLGTGDSAAPLATVLLAEMNMKVAPFRDTKASEVGSLLACNPNCQGTLADQPPAAFGNHTLADLVALLPVPSLQDLSVGQSLVAIVPPSEIPYELMNLERLLFEAEFRSSELLAFRVPFSVHCGTEGGLRAVLELANDARAVPGSATVEIGGGAPQPVSGPQGGFGEPPTFDLASVCEQTTGPTNAVLRFDAEPGSVLGLDLDSTVRIEGDFGSSVARTDDSSVDDSHDPGDELEQTLELTTEHIRTGHINSDADVDTFSFTGVPGETTISLAHLPEDFDLAILGPELGPESTGLRRTGLRRTDLSETAVPDSSEEPTDEAVLPPDTVEDLGLRRTGLRRTGLRRTSINRGTTDEAATVEIRPEEAGETFYAQVIGYNGATSPDPYVIRRIDRADEPALECPSRPLAGSAVTVPFPTASDVAGKEALYLVAPGRMATRDGSAEKTQEMIDRLQTLAEQTNGVVVPVEGDPEVDAAFGAWDTNPCSPTRANDVVTEINAVVDHVRGLDPDGLPGLRSLVIVGPDDVIPQARVPDHTVLANEAEYADDAAFNVDGDAALEDNAVSGSIRNGYMLSDDPLGDFDPGARLWTPDVALGRLIETPGQIEGQIDDFLDANGVVDPQRAFVTGYDFISDGASAQFDPLAARVGGSNAVSQISETWTATDADNGLSAAGAGFLAVNAHYDHFRLLPAAAFNGYDPNLLSAGEVEPPGGSTVFTVGCHAGLNLAIAGTASSSDPRLLDWAEQISARGGSLYAANTGYGYGDTVAVAYSERVMADYAAQLASGDVTTGQALMFAKQASAASVGVVDDYWNKAMMEATFYGLPMYRVGADGGVGDPALPPTGGSGETAATGGPQATGGVGTRSSTELDLDLEGDLHEVSTDRGSYWQVGDEEPLVVQRRPIQPKTTRDVTDTSDPEARARGYLIEGMTTQDVGGVDPVIGLPTIDLSENEPEPDADSPFFPARNATVAPEATPEGTVDRLTFIPGSFRDDTQRLIEQTDGRVLRSTDTGDFTAPTITRVDGNVVSGNFSIRVEVEGADALGGNVLYLTDAQSGSGGDLTWNRADLSVAGTGDGEAVLATGGQLPSGTEIAESIVQVYDTSHNLAVSPNKVAGYSFSPAPTGGEGDPAVLFTPERPASGYYTNSAGPQVSLDEGDHEDASFEYSVDGDAFRRYDGPFTIDGLTEGEHSVFFRGNDGSTALDRFAIDTGPPDIVATADRTAGLNGWYDGPVTVSFTCADAVSGVASCSDPVTLSDGRDRTATGTATDNAGNSSQTTFGPINIDSGDPTISGAATTAPNGSNGWYKTSPTVRFSCADSLSGLASCAGKSLTGGPANATNDVVASGEGAAVITTGDAFDLAGNAATASVSLKVDTVVPNVAIETPNNATLVRTQKLQGTADDATSGVSTVKVFYENVLGGQPEQKDAVLTCNAATCTWEAALPDRPGVYRAYAEATDFAGHTMTTPKTGFEITVG